MRYIAPTKCRQILIVAGFLLLCTTFPTDVSAFGKNKVNYDNFKWRYYQTEHFDFYYYEREKELVLPVFDMFEDVYDFLSDLFRHELTQKIPVILYEYGRHFEQTNVYPGFIPEGVGGFTEISKLRLVIPINGPRENLQELVVHELTHSFQYDILYDFRISAMIGGAPLWLMEGMADYLSNDLTAIGQMVLRDAVIHDFVPPLEDLYDFDLLPFPYLGYKIGQHAVEYLVEQFGWDRFLDLLWEVKKSWFNANIQKAAEEAYQVDFEKLDKDFIKRLEMQTWAFLSDREDPELVYGKEKYKTKFGFSNMGATFSPSGELIAYMSTKNEKVDVYIASVKGDREDLRALTTSHGLHTYRGIVSDGRPLTWSPDGDYVAFFVRKDKRRALLVVDIIADEIKKTYWLEEEEILSPSWSPDGEWIAFAGYRDGQSDIFALNLEAGITVKVTDDPFFDEFPDWSPNGRHIVYASERDGTFNIYIQDFSPDNVGVPKPYIVSDGNDFCPSFSPDGNYVVFLSDRTQLVNDVFLYDTRTEQTRQVTHVFTGIDNPEIAPDNSQILFTVFYKLTLHIHSIPLGWPAYKDIDKWEETPASIEIEKVELEEFEPPEKEKTERAPSFIDKREDKRPVEFFEYKDYPLREEPPSPLRMPFTMRPDYSSELGAAYRSDGIFIGQVAASFSDILGNHRVRLYGASVYNDQIFSVAYYYLKRRWDIGAVIFRDVDLLYGRTRLVRLRSKGAAAMFSYPLNTFYRIDTEIFSINYDYDTTLYRGFDVYAGGVFFSGDTVRYRSFGPYKGHRFSIGMRQGISQAEGESEYGDYAIYEGDYRFYVPITRSNLLAFRVAGIVSEFEHHLYSIGGAGTIRGFDYGEFAGTRIAFANFEFRFPLVTQAILFNLLPIYQLRGHVFLDTGLAWEKGDELDLWTREDGDFRLVDLKASIGLGFRLNMGAFELWFDFAARTDFDEVDEDLRYEFSIGRKF